MSQAAGVGDLVQIEAVVLPAGERSPQVPADTGGCPLVMRVKGYALAAAEPGQELEVETLIGRRVTGRLVTTQPRYDHDFGRPVPELTRAGLEARALLRELEAGALGGGTA